MTTTFINGNIFTTTPSQQAKFETTITIKNGLITHIGSPPPSPPSPPSAPSPTPRTQDDPPTPTIIDLRGNFLLPGFIDGHTHLNQLASALQKLDLTPCTSLPSIRAAISTYAASHPTKPRILARQWMHSMTGPHPPTKKMLDDLDPRPIYIDSKDLHSAWCNSAALAELNFTASTPDPPGGRIVRGNDGEPNGIVEETACVSIVWPYIARIATPIEKLGGLLSAMRELSSHGYTGAVDMAMDEEAWNTLLELRSQFSDPLPLRISAYWFIHPKGAEEEDEAQVMRALEMKEEYNDETSPDLRIVGVKMMCDGVVDACTAHLLQPYSQTTEGEEVHPGPVWEPEALQKVVRLASEKGLQCALHAIGDAAVNLAITTLEVAGIPPNPTNLQPPPSLRHRIEHLELTSPGDAQRLAALGITASIQPVHADPAILKAWPRLLGQERCGRAFAYKEFVDSGATTAVGTDAPTAPHAALANMYVACNRKSARVPGMENEVAQTEEGGGTKVEVLRNEQFGLSLCEALSAATAGSAYSCFSENRVGKLEVGMVADFAVVSMPGGEWKEGGLLGAKVVETWFGGRKVFHADS